MYVTIHTHTNTLKPSCIRRSHILDLLPPTGMEAGEAEYLSYRSYLVRKSLSHTDLFAS